MPVGAFGGRADIMDKLAPVGPVYQAGTLSGNPVAVAAGLATLEADSRRRASTTRLAASTERLVQGLTAAAAGRRRHLLRRLGRRHVRPLFRGQAAGELMPK